VIASALAPEPKHQNNIQGLPTIMTGMIEGTGL
jgi:hypothetical protein